MDKQVKEKWIAALRSGKYAQTKETLFDGTGYCCLGVLAEIHNVEGVLKTKSTIEINLFDGISNFPSDLPSKYREAIGLEKTHREELIHMNDTGKSFSSIADFIEKHL